MCYQFGRTPDLGCQDTVFVLKYFFQEKRKKLDAWVVFIDLVKVWDSIQYKLIDETLRIFGVPDNFRIWVRKLHFNCVVDLKVGKYKHYVPHRFSVK